MKKYWLWLAMKSLFLAVFVAFDGSFCQTLAAPGIEGDVEVWKKENSPYSIMTDKTVKRGQTLIIEPGVVVALSNGSRLIVEGRLLAVGSPTATSPIVFTSMKDYPLTRSLFPEDQVLPPFEANLDEWDAILFVNPDMDEPSILYHCVLKYADNVIICSNSYPVLSQIKIEWNSRAQLKVNGSSLQVDPEFTNYGPREYDIFLSLASAQKLSLGDTLAVPVTIENRSEGPIDHIHFAILEVDTDLPFEWIDRPVPESDKKIEPFQNADLLLQFHVSGEQSGDINIRGMVLARSLDGEVVYASQMVDLAPLRVEPPPLPLLAPDQLKGSALGDSGAVLNWIDRSSDEDGFVIEMSTPWPANKKSADLSKIETADWNVTGSLPADLASYKVEGLSPDSRYAFRVRAIRDGHYSSYTIPVIVTTEPEKTTAAAGKPFYKKWWFWGGVGGAGLTAAAILMGGQDETTVLPANELPGPPNLPPRTN